MSAQHPWYSEEAGHFGPHYLATYTDTLPPERTTREVDFIMKVLRLTPEMSILDCPCGHGRHSVELAKRGHRVVGQDLNGFFIEEAKKAARSADVEVNFRKGDLRDLPWESEFNVALNLFTAFGYLETEEEDQKAMGAVAQTLKSGGKFLIDFINRERVLKGWQNKGWEQLKSGIKVLHDRRFDIHTGREERDSLYISLEGQVVSSWHVSLRLYTVRELIQMGRAAGLHFVESFGDFDGSPISTVSQRIILVMEKK